MIAIPITCFLMYNAIASRLLSNRSHEIFELLTHKQSPALLDSGLLDYLAGTTAGAVVEALKGVLGRVED